MESPEVRKTEARTILAQQHEHWKQSAITIGAKKLLDELETKFVDFVTNHAVDEKVSDERIRIYAAQLLTVRQIKQLLFDQTTYAEKTIK